MSKHIETRRNFLKKIGLLSTAMATGSLSGCASVMNSKKPAKRPNFVFILVDDLGWTDLGCFGSSFYETPNIDRLASESMKFTDGYAACPVCSPTRASIMAGKYPARMDTTDYFGAAGPNARRWENKKVLPAAYINRLPLEEVTIAEASRRQITIRFLRVSGTLAPVKSSGPSSRALMLTKEATPKADLMDRVNILYPTEIRVWKTGQKASIFRID